MATIRGNKQQLIAAHLEIQNFREVYPTIAAMIGGRIESFYKANDHKLNAAFDKRVRIYEKYVAKNEDGTFKHDEKGVAVLLEPGNAAELTAEELEKEKKHLEQVFSQELTAFLSEGVEYIV